VLLRLAYLDVTNTFAMLRVARQNSIEDLTRCFLVGSGCASVLVDQSAEGSVASDRGAERVWVPNW